MLPTIAATHMGTSEVHNFISSACRGDDGLTRRDENRRAVALCGRCGRRRTVNEARDVPPLCLDCRVAEKWTAPPTDSDALRDGQWVRQGGIKVWKPTPRQSARRCRDCGEPTRDQHRTTERCRRCWKIAKSAAAAQRAAERAAQQAEREAERIAANERRRAASAVRCCDCNRALTTRHRTVQRCRRCWKIAVKATSSDAAHAPAEPRTYCDVDGCLLTHPDEACPACTAAAADETTAA